MRKLLVLLLLPALALSLAGCVAHRTPVRPPEGLLFTQYKAPLTVNFENAKLGTKTGVAKTMYIFVPFIGIDFAWSRCDIEAAAKNGGIQTVTYADYEVIKVLGLFGEFTVRAHSD